MNLLIVAATFFEIRPFLDRLSPNGMIGEHLFQFRYQELNIDALVTGVGMVNTSYHLGRQLTLKKYDLVVNAGVAGTFRKEIPLGTVAHITADSIPEFGAEDGDRFISIFELGFFDPDSPPFTNGKLCSSVDVPPTTADLDFLNKLPRLTGITSNTIRGSASSVARIRQLADADVESMEGAAFLFACLSEGIPCIQLRSISNLVEKRDKSKWDLPLALKNLNHVLWRLLIEKNQ
jgi:futalosine hydrolase